jgi:hypothetical protein
MWDTTQMLLRERQTVQARGLLGAGHGRYAGLVGTTLLFKDQLIQ